MRDPHEGMAPDGTIVTGAARSRVPPVFEPVLAAAVEAVGGEVTLLLYGSVATGQAAPPGSDVDLVALGWDSSRRAAADDLARRLSRRFADRCRAVEIGCAAGPATGEDDESYGNRVFQRHYCVPLTGSRPWPVEPAFPADVRAARGFNGDVALHARRWAGALAGGAEPSRLARTVARKTHLALAGVVSVHDGTWTTDRAKAARRWGEVEPDRAPDLDLLLGWSEAVGSTAPPTGDDGRAALDAALHGVVAHVVRRFGQEVGFWARSEEPDAGPLR